MRRFRFYAMGRNFDADTYLGQFSIDYSRTWDSKHEYSGLVKYLGNEYVLSLYKQEEIAYKYMHKNKSALKELVHWQNIELSFLCLSCEFQIDSSPTSTYFSFEPETMALAGEIGLRLAFDVEASIADDWYTPSAAEY